MVDEHDVRNLLDALDRLVRARRILRLAERVQQAVVEHVLDERGLARAAHAGHGDEAAQRNLDVDVLQVVLGRAAHRELRGRVDRRLARARRGDLALAAQILRGQRVGLGQQLARRAVEHDLAARAAGPRAEVEDAVGREHDLSVVLDHEQRVARVAQPREHVHHAAEIARMEPDARLVEHEQRVDERRAERGREVDPLHLAAGKRA